MNSKYQKLLSDLQSIDLPPSVIREILQASFGLKICRTSIADNKFAKLIEILEAAQLYVGISKMKYFACPDQGKGGWCNAPPILLDPQVKLGEHFLYIGLNPEKVFSALQNEEVGEEEFANELSIPKCCSDFYLSTIEQARQVQNDLLPFSFINTHEAYPYNLWTNMASQYFGYALNSFFPCSFNCQHAENIAKKTAEILQNVDEDFANEFLRYQTMNYLYTEYEGIFAIEHSEFKNNVLNYDNNKIISTNNGLIYSALKRGNTIEVIDKHHYLIMANSTVLMDLQTDYLSLLIFNDKDYLN